MNDLSTKWRRRPDVAGCYGKHGVDYVVVTTAVMVLGGGEITVYSSPDDENGQHALFTVSFLKAFERINDTQDGN